MPSSWLYEHFAGCLLGAAIGDALGAPTETRTPEAIFERFGGYVTGFAPPFELNRPDGRYKGDGRITDDTLMTLQFCNLYLRNRRHLCAHDAVQLADAIMEPDTYVPEYDKQMPLILRLFYPEKWLFQRLRLASVDPREGGIGNAVNCGCAMYIAPVGLINAGQPRAAYNEAIDWAGAHTLSYGREAAGVLAACVAEALRPGATWQDVVAVALDMAKDGTRAAIEALQTAAQSLPPFSAESETAESGVARASALRAVMLPFDTLKEPNKSYTQYGRYPSRVHSIEELPLALAYLAWAQGNYRRAALGGANYGRDSDSIASMAGALAGALGGRAAIPAEWIQTVEQVNHLEIEALSHRMADLAGEIFAADWAQAQARQQALGAHFCAKNGA